MSNIAYSTILTNYPTPGQDNSTQGFRDNFQTIYTALETANLEVSRLQTRTVLAADLTSSGGTPVVNNLNGSQITNGLFNQFSGIYYPQLQLDNTSPNYLSMTSDFTNGVMQQFSIKYTNTAIEFINWPQNGTPTNSSYYSVQRLMIKSNDLTSVKTVTFTTEKSGSVVASSDSIGLLTSTGGVGTLSLGTAGSVLATNQTGNLISVDTYSSLAVGQTIKFAGTSGNGITVGTVYYITSVVGNAITVSTTQGGSAITIPVTGAPSAPITYIAGVEKIQLLEAFTVDSGSHVYIRRLGEF